jgi:arylsulfatase A-like enzyme
LSARGPIAPIALALSLALLAEPGTAAATPRRPNLVFLLVDDLGHGDLGFTGARDIETPHIDRLARAGVRLSNGYSNGPVCTPTRAAFMTGRYQQRVGLEWAISAGQREPGLPTTAPSIARLLKDAGYATGLVGKWHLGYKPEFGPNAHGFDEFFGSLSGNIDHYTHRESHGGGDLHENTTAIERAGYSTDLLTAAAISFVDRHRARPFFLYLSYNAPHWPFQPPDAPDTVRTKATWYTGTRRDYARMIDASIEGWASCWRRWSATASDVTPSSSSPATTGASVCRETPPSSITRGPCGEGGIHVPYVLRWPAVARVPAMTMDITATFLAAAGVTPPITLDGSDLLPWLAGRGRPPERTLHWRIDREERKQRAARSGRWKYVRDGKTIDLLFDLDRDPGERENVAAAHPDVVARLRADLARWEADMDAGYTGTRVR